MSDPQHWADPYTGDPDPPSDSCSGSPSTPPIRSRVLSWLGQTPDADDIYSAGAIFHDCGGRSWPVFVREVRRMERDGLIEIHRDVDEMDDVWLRLPEASGA